MIIGDSGGLFPARIKFGDHLLDICFINFDIKQLREGFQPAKDFMNTVLCFIKFIFMHAIFR